MRQTIRLTENDIKNMVYKVFEAIASEDTGNVIDDIYGPDDIEYDDDTPKEKRRDRNDVLARLRNRFGGAAQGWKNGRCVIDRNEYDAFELGNWVNFAKYCLNSGDPQKAIEFLEFFINAYNRHKEIKDRDKGSIIPKGLYTPQNRNDV